MRSKPTAERTGQNTRPETSENVMLRQITVWQAEG
jgi:hypothetical protein